MERSLSAAQRTHLSLRAVSLGARVTGEQVERSLSAAQSNTPVMRDTLSSSSLGARVTGEQVERSLSAAQRTHLSLRAVSLGARVTGEQVERSLSAAQSNTPVIEEP